ncbi:MAG: NADH-quinone oxidoreductase subunit M [Herpetosiphonaceae bacterium]|nr:NADH-quinone oxidoreductase subunit M [Herpetosiphonaceae bacterium]
MLNTNYLAFSNDALHSIPWLSLLIFLPLIGALLTALWPERGDARTNKWGAFALSLAPLGIAILLATQFQGTRVDNGLQQVYEFPERLNWVSVLGVQYFLGLDGISLPLVLLCTIMTPVCILASFNLQFRPRYFLALLLLMETAMLGVFLSLNFFLFFIFWEVSLIPGYYLISVWGRENRRYASFKFFVYTMAGSVGMLLGFEFLYLATSQAGRGTFDIVELTRLAQGLPVQINATAGNFRGDLQTIVYTYFSSLRFTELLGGASAFGMMSGIFWAVFVALAVKLAVWPFHTWLPDAYSEAPTAGSMLISSVLTKMGAYAMLRLMLPLFPAQMQRYASILGFLAFASIIIGAWVAYNQRDADVKRLISYLSINHMGYVMLAIAAAGAAGLANVDSRATAINGAVMQMVAHGLSTGALFFLAGILAERTGSYRLPDFGGLRTLIPVFAGAMGVAMFANLGLPGMAGFVGEFFIFRGTWTTLPLLTIFAMLGLVISALALLLMYQRIFSGPVNERWRGIPDLTLREWGVVLPLLALLIVWGIYPLPLMRIANSTAIALVQFFSHT